MSEIVSMIAHMEAKGIECRVILEAVKALAAAKDDAIEERRAVDRARKARQRTAQREALKAQAISHVTPAESTDSADRISSPPVSPLFPSPTPLTNNPPLSPPTVEVEGASARKSKSSKRFRLPADWTPPAEFVEFARNHRDANFPDFRMTDEEIEREGFNIRDWSANSPNGAKLDWFAAWRNWIRGKTAEIVRTRPRSANGASQRSGYGKPQTRFAPNLSLHDALALAGTEAGDPQCGAGWEPDHGYDPDPPVRSPRLEIIDSADARRPGASGPERDHGNARQTVLPLPLHAVR